VLATATVRGVYRRAAAGDFRGAWRPPGMRRAFRNRREPFRRDLSSLRRADFREVIRRRARPRCRHRGDPRLATHADRIDRCSRRLRTIRGTGRRWVGEPAGVQCTPG
jgi:hypothetical protein